MLKSSTFKACLLAAVLVFCLSLNGFSAKPCRPPDCPPNISTIPETVQYSAGWLLEWDPSNPDEIARNNDVLLKVISGTPPYTWSVGGTGFTLENETTQGLSNRLYADNTACVATVTVSDSRGQSVSGDVRCNCGGWVSKGSICGLEGTYDTKSYSSWASAYIYTKELGNRRQTQAVSGSYGDVDCELRCRANSGTGNNPRCNRVYGCEGCIAKDDYEQWHNDNGYCVCTMSLHYYEYECP